MGVKYGLQGIKNKLNMETDNRYLQVLNIFKSKDFLKPGLTTPHLQDGKYYASEGQTMVFFNESLCPGIASKNEYAPDYLSVIPTDSNSEIIIDGAKIQELINNLVPKIDETKACLYCDGEGFQECDLGHEHDCEQCEGQGFIKVMPITQVINPEAFILIYDVCFTVKFFQKLLSAMHVFNIKECLWVKKEANKANLFTLGDITILLMPVRCLDLCDEYEKYEQVVIL